MKSQRSRALRGRSKQRPYINVHSMKTNPGAGDLKAAPTIYIVSECLQWNKVYETGEVWDTSYPVGPLMTVGG